MKKLLPASLLLCLLPLHAQDKPAPKPPAKPAAPATKPLAKPSIKDAATEALNRLKLDERNKEKLDKAKKAAEEALKKHEGAEKIIDRIKEKIPAGGDVKKAADDAAAKMNVNPEDLKKSKEELEKGLRQLEQSGRKFKDAPSPPPAGNKNVPAVSKTFDQMPLPGALTAAVEPAAPSVPLITADHMIPPAISLKGERTGDIRSRTYIGQGNSMIRQATMAVDSDDITIVLNEDFDSPDKKKKDALTVKPEDDFDFERVTARGRVRVIMLSAADGIVYVAKASNMVLDGKTGEIILTGWPEVQWGEQCLVSSSANSTFRFKKSGDKLIPDLQGSPSFVKSLRSTGKADIPRTADKPVPSPSPRADR